MIPVGDTPRTRSLPWVNYALIGVNILVFLYTLTLAADLAPTRLERFAQLRAQTEGVCYGFLAEPTEVNAFYCRWGFQPREFFDAVAGTLPQGSDRLAILFTILTSLFIHGGWLHIVGNMLFLWIFGDNVEDRLGHAGYLAFYVLAGAAANVVQASIDPNSLVPVVGASGAIAGVLGAYLVMFPTAVIHVLVPVFIFFLVPIPIPAVVMIGIWFLQNLLAGFATLGDAATPDAGVAWFAHIGGFLFGFAFAALFAREPRRAPPRSYPL
ncbi:hypothetical protein HRbin29_02172 [bacterium HR29]|nr:hypothetical protein HRbin29_02172 [bacterium HR29]